MPRYERVCENCGKSFSRFINKGRNPPSYCDRKCYDEGNFIWELATDDEKLNRYRQSYEKLVVRNEGCWDWKGYIAPTGYAEIGKSKNGLEKHAHRVSWIIHNGWIPQGRWVLHHCDNPVCTNPDHLFLGTTQENTSDRHKKGRTLKGSEVKTSVLTEEMVTLIKQEITKGNSCLQISRKFHVSNDSIKRINRNERWVHVPWPTDKIGNGRIGSRKITEEQVKEIKRLLKLGVPCSKLGRDYGVTKEAIHAIKIGKNWKHVTID